MLSGIERVAALAMQVTLTILVLKAVRQKNFKILVLAITLHMLIDAPLALLSPFGNLVTEGYVLICASIGVWYIITAPKEEWDFSDKKPSLQAQ